MTISTPSPIDKPDWNSPVLNAGEVIAPNGTAATVLTSDSLGFYVANGASYTFTADMTDAEGGWEFDLYDGTTQTGPSPWDDLPETYEGFGPCRIYDTLPVIGPWVVPAFANPTSGSNVCGIVIVSSLQTTRGANRHLFGSVCIEETAGAAAATTTTTIYGTFLSPGLYQYSMYTASGLGAGQIQFAGIDKTGSPHVLVRHTNPPAFFEDNGQLIVGNYQPVFQMVNASADPGTFKCFLTGPL